MLKLAPKPSSNWNIIKFGAAAAAMAVLAGCALAVPLPPLTTSSQDSHNGGFVCGASSKCSNKTTPRRVAHRSQLVNSPKLDDNPPDFILNNGDQGFAR